MSGARRLQLLMPWLVVLGLFLIWEAGCWAFDVPPFVLPGEVVKTVCEAAPSTIV